jgi:hypothetical protein
LMWQDIQVVRAKLDEFLGRSPIEIQD